MAFFFRVPKHRFINCLFITCSWTMFRFHLVFDMHKSQPQLNIVVDRLSFSLSYHIVDIFTNQLNDNNHINVQNHKQIAQNQTTLYQSPN